MKTKLFGFGLALTLLSFGGSTFAQGANAHPALSPEEIRQRVEALKARLQLTPEQMEKLRPLVKEEIEKFRAIRDKYAADTSFKARRAKLREAKAVQDEFDGKLEQILNENQMKEWKKIRKERRARVKEELEQRRAIN